jgi:hypothetical protein
MYLRRLNRCVGGSLSGDLASLILRQVEAADAETVSGCGLGQSDRTGAGPWVTLVGRGVRAGSTW